MVGKEEETLVEILVVTGTGESFHANVLLERHWSGVMPREWKQIGGALASTVAAHMRGLQPVAGEQMAAQSA